MSFLEAERLVDEREVSSKKWFDYRFLSAIEATQAFHNIYQEIYREMWGRHFDVEKAHLKRGAPLAGLLSNGREFNGTWGARQIADGLGLPYDFFIREAMEAAFRRGVRRPPRPNQLYDERNIAVVRERWEERCSSFPMISYLPQYRLESFRGLPAQIEHQDWMVTNLKARLASNHAIARACFEQRVLPVDHAEAEFSPYQMEQVRREGADMSAEPMEPLPESAFWPSCFGLPHAHSEASPICIACQAREACSRAEAQIREQTVAMYGTERPRDDEKRAQGRDRVARYRAKKAVAAPSPGPQTGCRGL
ncbi:hypothetical protein [Methylobacterium durans]|uniref:Uncharacterized protein n=1 Tax=Methylobacterium durans TaxID=2202825 RepID=A0A2U8W306_9HYPH|nr:hypothetical protein [Methylobacterium durans]AWN40475.1 hypothetical protein DK389_07940 [Methylobacterium durans]